MINGCLLSAREERCGTGLSQFDRFISALRCWGALPA